jgi:hypothetical protein
MGICHSHDPKSSDSDTVRVPNNWMKADYLDHVSHERYTYIGTIIDEKHHENSNPGYECRLNDRATSSDQDRAGSTK